MSDSLNGYIDTVIALKRRFDKSVAPLRAEGEDADLKSIDEAVNEVKKFKQENKAAVLINNVEKLSEPYFTVISKPIKPKKMR